MRRSSQRLLPKFVAMWQLVVGALVWASFSLANVDGGVPFSPPPLPTQGPTPLLFVRFHAPKGMNVTFYPQPNDVRSFTAPTTAGLRPGYLYRVKLSHLPGRQPNFALYPTLEVRGTLNLPQVIRAANHPAPVVFSPEDIDQVLRGALLTKVVFLEHPDLAIASPSKPDQPLEIDTPPGSDPVDEARSRGRLLLIVRLGEREVTPEELARQAVPGTVLLAGAPRLGPPACPPWIPWACVPIVDPLLGPKVPDEECLHDGGDSGTPAGLDRNGQVRGLDPSDSVASYSDSRGRRHLAISNRVCLCVPRFVVARGETNLVGYNSVVAVGDTERVQRHIQIAAPLPSLETLQNEKVDGMRGRLRPSATMVSLGVQRTIKVEVLNAHQLEIGVWEKIGGEGLRQLTSEQRTEITRQIAFAQQFAKPYGLRGVTGDVLGPRVLGRIDGVQVTSGVQETRDITSSCQEPPEAPDQPLHLYKWASTRSAQIGDVITFFLKYSNGGGQPIEEVAVSDSLTGRLEYIPGSAKANRDAVFTTQDNEAGSLILHWEINGRLLPGQNGVVSFQARIR